MFPLAARDFANWSLAQFSLLLRAVHGIREDSQTHKTCQQVALPRSSLT